MSLNRMRSGAPSCRVVTAARRLSWRGIVPGVSLQEAAFDREAIGMRTPETAEASMAGDTVLLRSAVVAIGSALLLLR